MAKLDLDLSRQILLALEAQPAAHAGRATTIEIEGHEPEDVSYHVMLLCEAGFVEGRDMSQLRKSIWAAKSLTFSGHQYLESIRNDTVWARVKKEASAKGIPLTVSAVSALATHFGKQLLKDNFGIEIGS